MDVFLAALLLEDNASVNISYPIMSLDVLLFIKIMPTHLGYANAMAIKGDFSNAEARSDNFNFTFLSI